MVHDQVIETRQRRTSSVFQPKLCHLIKGRSGYGFNLVKAEAEGHFISDIDPNGPANLGGLVDGDRIIEVNGVNVENELHTRVAWKIRDSLGHQVKLLVVDQAADNWFKNTGLSINSQTKNIIHYKSPDIRNTINGDSEEENHTPDVRTGRARSGDFHRFSVPMPPSPPLVKNVRRVGADVTPDGLYDDVNNIQRNSSEQLRNGIIKRDSRNELKSDLTPELDKVRICLIKILPNYKGLGFKLLSKSNGKGHFIVEIDQGSPAHEADLKVHDRVLEVNGANVEKKKHIEVVKMISSSEFEIELLVVNDDTYQYHMEAGIPLVAPKKNVTPQISVTSVGEKNVTSKNGKSGRISLISTHLQAEEEEENMKSQDKYFAEYSQINKHDVSENNSVERSFSTYKYCETVCNRRPVNIEREIINQVPKKIDVASDAPKPRLCIMNRHDKKIGYGFTLRTYEDTNVKYIADVDKYSIAEKAGIKPWDRVIEVNGVNIGNDNHSQISERIRSYPNRVKLLLLQEDDYEWYSKMKLIPRGTQSNVIVLNGYSKANEEDEEDDDEEDEEVDKEECDRNNIDAYAKEDYLDEYSENNDDEVQGSCTMNQPTNQSSDESSDEVEKKMQIKRKEKDTMRMLDGSSNSTDIKLMTILDSLSANQMRELIAGRKKYDPRKKGKNFQERLDIFEKI